MIVNSLAVADCTQLNRKEWSWHTCIENDLQELQALVVSFRSKTVLLHKEKEDWVLPGRLYSRVEFSSAFSPASIIPDVQDLIHSKSPLIFLRQVWRRTTPVDIEGCSLEYEKSVVLLEFSDEIIASDCSGSIPWCSSTNDKVWNWVSVEQAEVFHLIDEAAKIIADELRFVADSIQPANRLSWQRPGWFQTATSWMINKLSNNCDAMLTGDLTQLRSSHLGVILKAETTKGCFFLKCTSNTSNDAFFTRTLACLSPSHVTSPVDVDTEKQLLLTSDYGDILQPWDLSQPEKCRLASSYAHLQMDAMENVEKLILSGFPDMRVCKLLEHVDRLDHCSLFRSLNTFDEKEDNEVLLFRKRKQEIKKELKKLEVLPELSATVTHNDLLCSNIYLNEETGKYMFFDFVDSYISHPFAFLMGDMDEKQYLSEWSKATGITVQKLEDLLWPGYRCHLLAVLVLRLQEAQTVEFPESEQSLGEAYRALRLLNGSMMMNDDENGLLQG